MPAGLEMRSEHNTGWELGSVEWLVDVVAALPNARSGVAFIANTLDRLVERFNLRHAVAIVDDPALGTQIFTPGRRPLDGPASPSELLRRGPGVHTDPPLEGGADELAAIISLFQVALRLDRLRHESMHDSLTGLYNRRGFEVQLTHAISRSVRYGWSFAFVLIDLDDFKAINDKLGHLGGDRVLRELGDALRRGLRAGDVAARVGGDEFALLLHVERDVDLDAVLERLRSRVGLGQAVRVPIGWTAGVARCPEEASTINGLYQLADDRLYEGKGGGPAADG